MTSLALVTDNGPTDAQWREMTALPARFKPLIVHLAGFYVMAGATEDDRDFPAIGIEVETFVPGWSELTSDEAYFVHVGAVHLLCNYDATEALSELAAAWLEDGAPE